MRLQLLINILCVELFSKHTLFFFISLFFSKLHIHKSTLSYSAFGVFFLGEEKWLKKPSTNQYIFDWKGKPEVNLIKLFWYKITHTFL
jgi:hypothetical protein